MSEEFFTAFFGIGFVFATIVSIRLVLRYRRVAHELDPEPNILGAGAVIIAIVVTIALGFFGAISARRLNGAAPLDWTPIAGTVVAGLVLYGIPIVLEVMFQLIERQGKRIHKEDPYRR